MVERITQAFMRDIEAKEKLKVNPNIVFFFLKNPCLFLKDF
jgi:hypothetical protein